MIKYVENMHAGEIVVTGNTYPRRNALRARGARWNAADKSWRFDYDTTIPRWLESELGAVCDGAATTQTATTAKAPEVTRLDHDDWERVQKAIQVAVNGKADELKPDVAEAVKDDLAALAEAVQTGVAEQVALQTAALESRVALAEKRAEESRVLEVRTDKGAFKVEGRAHPLLDTLITSLGAGLHVWIAGPSGSGKTHGAMQAAKALGLDFEAHGAMTMAHELTGFVDAGGKYHETPFVRAFRNGGLVLLDEIDAGSNEALLALNAALANGFMSLPSGEVIEAHPDFRCIGAANTFGNGATAEYVGRVRLDAAFLQRFGARLDWGYDEELERQISGNVDWAKRVQRARRRAADAGLKIMITPRQSQAGAKLIAAGMSEDDAANLTYLAGLSPEQRRQIEG
jgi:MoxR-like ATPase